MQIMLFYPKTGVFFSMKNLKLELLLSDRACQIIDNFAFLMNLQVVFYSIDGQIVKRGRDEHNCAYCKYMQEKIFSFEDCCDLDLKKQNECREKQKTIVYQCHAGLTEVITPVEIYGNVAGYVIIGQFRMNNKLPDFIDSKEVADLYLAQKHITFKELDRIIEMFKTLLEYITEKELITTAADFKIMKINSYIEKNILNEITLAKVAKYMNCSVSSLSHYLQEKHNTTLKTLIRNRRILYAEELMKKHPDLNLSEIAGLAGFNDSHYFSRVYRRHRNFPPSEFHSGILKKI